MSSLKYYLNLFCIINEIIFRETVFCCILSFSIKRGGRPWYYNMARDDYCRKIGNNPRFVRARVSS